MPVESTAVVPVPSSNFQYARSPASEGTHAVGLDDELELDDVELLDVDEVLDDVELELEDDVLELELDDVELDDEDELVELEELEPQPFTPTDSVSALSAGFGSPVPER